MDKIALSEKVCDGNTCAYFAYSRVYPYAIRNDEDVAGYTQTDKNGKTVISMQSAYLSSNGNLYVLGDDNYFRLQIGNLAYAHNSAQLEITHISTFDDDKHHIADMEVMSVQPENGGISTVVKYTDNSTVIPEDIIERLITQDMQHEQLERQRLN